MTDEAKQDEPTLKSAAEVFNVTRDQPPPTPGLSQSPGLRPLENSPVPGADRMHVVGPQQSAVDPVLAGLDMRHNPMTRAENRVITRADGVNVVPPPDTASEAIPGPSGTSAPAAEGNREAAELITPTTVQTPAPVAQPVAPAAAEPV